MRTEIRIEDASFMGAEGERRSTCSWERKAGRTRDRRKNKTKNLAEEMRSDATGVNHS